MYAIYMYVKAGNGTSPGLASLDQLRWEDNFCYFSHGPALTFSGNRSKSKLGQGIYGGPGHATRYYSRQFGLDVIITPSPSPNLNHSSRQFFVFFFADCAVVLHDRKNLTAHPTMGLTTLVVAPLDNVKHHGSFRNDTTNSPWELGVYSQVNFGWSAG